VKNLYNPTVHHYLLTMTSEDNGSETYECVEGNLLERLGCILSYNSHIPDCILNYTLVVVSLIYCTLTVHNHTRDEQKASQLLRFAVGALLAMTVLQLTLGLTLGCSGISIIWCAMGGWIMSERRRVLDGQDEAEELSPSVQRVMKGGLMVILFDAAAIIYYAVVAEPITSVAHFCALIVGAILSKISIKLYDEPPDNPTSEPLLSST
jgi:hypothetical protein